MKNEHKYKTPEERNDAFSEWCFNRTCESCELKSHNFDGSDGCKFYWLALEADEAKPNPCPFCGGETHINLGLLKADILHYWVDCISPECMYRSAHYTDKDAAIAAHNRVCSAVETVKKGDMK